MLGQRRYGWLTQVLSIISYSFNGLKWHYILNSRAATEDLKPQFITSG